MNKSIATIDSPEFINLQPLDINPLMSKCEIKVLYVDKNRNRSFISKETATEIGKTLRGAPIVGWYKKEKEDFADHGEVITIDDEGIHFDCMTVPYGFVAPDAEVWFQKFTDTDEFGNETVREYLMTTGFLWTGQFEEARKVLKGEGKPQSMELDEKTLEGHWAEDTNLNMEFFIINDAIVSKLCILGDDVEPCFEGASITKPTQSLDYSLNTDKQIKNTLFSMMQDLKNVLKGEQAMPEDTSIVKDEKEVVDPAEVAPVEEAPAADDTNSLDNSNETPAEENQETSEGLENSDFTNKADESNKADEKFELLQSKYEDLKTQFANLKKEYDSLVEFKNNVESEKKDELISSFSTLSDEDKKDVIENKAKYSLSEIESKLSIIFTKQQMKKMSETHTEGDSVTPVTTFNLKDEVVPGWLSALRNTKNNEN